MSDYNAHTVETMSMTYILYDTVLYDSSIAVVFL